MKLDMASDPWFYLVCPWFVLGYLHIFYMTFNQTERGPTPLLKWVYLPREYTFHSHLSKIKKISPRRNQIN